MPGAPKYILHCPLSDNSRLEEFVERCLSEGASLLAIVGHGCAELEDIILDIVVGDGSSSDRFLATTSHPDEPLEDVVALVRSWERDAAGETIQIRL